MWLQTDKNFSIQNFWRNFPSHNILCLSYLGQFHPFRSPYPSLPPPLLIWCSLSWWQEAGLCSVIKTSCWSRLDILITSHKITLTVTLGWEMNQDQEGRYSPQPAPTTHHITLFNYSHFSRLELAWIYEMLSSATQLKPGLSSSVIRHVSESQVTLS